MFRRKLLYRPNVNEDPLGRVNLSFQFPSFISRIIIFLLLKTKKCRGLTTQFFVIDSKKVRFCRNSKCGSTSIVNALAEEYPEIVAVPIWKWWDKSNSYLTFTVYRNPEERLHSCYKWMRILGRHQKYTNNFDEFKSHTQKYPFKDQHWLPQEHYTKRSDVILRFENLEEDFKLFCKRTGLDRVSFPLPFCKKTQN